MFSVTTHRILEPSYRLLRYRAYGKRLEPIHLAEPVARTSPFDKRSRAVAYQWVCRLYIRASFLNSGYRKEADGLGAEPR
jgi:hypothetical protein